MLPGMAPSLADAARPATTALRTTLLDPSLRRMILAWFAMMAGKCAVLVTTLVVAYERGGPTRRRRARPGALPDPDDPGTLRQPARGALVDRDRPARTNAVRTLAVVATVVVVAIDAPFPLLALVVAIEAGVSAFTRPAPYGVAARRRRLTGDNSSPPMSRRVRPRGSARSSVRPSVDCCSSPAEPSAPSCPSSRSTRSASPRRSGCGYRPSADAIDRSGPARARRAAGGARAAIRLPGPRLVLIGFGLQTFIRGMLTVIIVVAAIEILGMGEPGVGTLNAALGLGGLAGAFGAITLAGRERLGTLVRAGAGRLGRPDHRHRDHRPTGDRDPMMVAIGVSNAQLDVAGIHPRPAHDAERGPGGGPRPDRQRRESRTGARRHRRTVAHRRARHAGCAHRDRRGLARRRPRHLALVRRLDEGGPAAVRRVELIRAQPMFGPLSLATVEHLAARLGPVPGRGRRVADARR